MAPAPFLTKQFELQQSQSAMPVGTDGMLLGAYIATLPLLRSAQRVLDVGTGTGVMPLMLLQQAPHLEVEAIEIDEGSCLDARHNFAHSPWREQVSLIQGDFLEYQAVHPYDLIISNPPYYIDQHWNDTPRETRAKHVTSLTPEFFFGHASELLTDADSASIILIVATSSLAHFLQAARHSSLQLSQILYISTRRGKTPKRAILHFQRQVLGEPVEQSLEILIGTGRHDYSDAYRRLLEPYLLIL